MQLGTIQLEKTTLMVMHENHHHDGHGEFRVWGDGCAFPNLNREQACTLLSLIVAWLDYDDKMNAEKALKEQS